MTNVKLFVSGLWIVIVFACCDNEASSTKTLIDVANEDRMATIIVKGYADLDFQTFGSEAVPDGTKVLFTVPKSCFVSEASGDLAFQFFFKDGTVVAEVPATETGVTYTISLVDFESDAITHPLRYQTNSLLMRYTLASVTQLVKIGEDAVLDVFYSSLIDDVQYTEWATLTGDVEGEFDHHSVGSEDLDENVELVFTNSARTWTKSVITNKHTFEVRVPEGEEIICQYSFVCANSVDLNDSTYEDCIYSGFYDFGVITDDTFQKINVFVGQK